MPRYIDGFVFPINRDHLERYKSVASVVAEIYCEHGAIEYIEFVGDDLHRDGTRPFPEMMECGESETIVFGWIVYDSRETRDAVNKKIEEDPRMMDLVAPLMDPKTMIFDASRMAFGGFKALVASDGVS